MEIVIPEILRKPLRGELFLTMYKGKKRLFSHNQCNMIVNNGLLVMANLLASNFTDFQISQIGFGDGTTDPAVTDQDLQGDLKSKKAIDSVKTTTYGSNKARIYWSIIYNDDISGIDLGSGVWPAGDSFTITEFGLYTANNTLFNRIVWNGPDLVMDTDITLEGYFQITVSGL